MRISYWSADVCSSDLNRRRICFLSMPANRTVRKKLMVTVPTDVSAHDIVETVRSSILVLSEDLHVISANRAFYTTFGVTPEETIGRFVYDLGNGYLSKIGRAHV